jgi:hypothetical protein
MKGIVTDFNVDKGFGFIKDEFKNNRTFNISNINEQVKFLSNIPDYVYDPWDEIICFEVNFKPTENENGLSAIDIVLTDQVYNGKFTNDI